MNNIIDEYIYNQLPLYLLSLRDMKLLRRSAVKDFIQADIEIFIKRNLPTDFQSSLEDVSKRTKVWIIEHTSYAIFSHRWLSTGELTFDDVRKFEKLHPAAFQRSGSNNERHTIQTSGEILDVFGSCATNRPRDEVKRDFSLLNAMKHFCGRLSDEQRTGCPDLVKLIEFCDIARQQHCNLVWFDTGCIDKSRSAELEESIRSMFNWYRRSKVCIVHLADTRGLSSLKRDPWFTRGWTLQELLAPERILFFGASWYRITPQRSQSDNNDKVGDEILGVPLWETISTVTEISVVHLLAFSPGITHARDALVWASNRSTTRIEDIAYCLIGLLDIPLSIAYGEGLMAFYRLQVEILHRSPDMGLFAWVGEPSPHNSMLAASAGCFSALPIKYSIAEALPDDSGDRAHMLTNRGLRIPLPVYDMRIRRPMTKGGQERVQFEVQVEELGKVPLERSHPGQYERRRVAILNDVTDGSATLAILLGYSKGRWTRIPTTEHIKLALPTKLKEPVTICIQ